MAEQVYSTPQGIGGWGEPEPLAAFLGSLAELVGAIAWPLALIFLVLWFRKPVNDLLNRLKTAKAAGFDFGFSESLASAEEATSRAIEEAPESLAEDIERVSHEKSAHMAALEDSQRKDPSEDESEKSAGHVVMLFWDSVLQELTNLWSLVGERLQPPEELVNIRAVRKPSNRAKVLAHNDVITRSTANAINELERLRNLVAHKGQHVTGSQATSYALSAARVEAILREARESLGQSNQQSS